MYTLPVSAYQDKHPFPGDGLKSDENTWGHIRLAGIFS
jgi:hypothetical protein